MKPFALALCLATLALAGCVELVPTPETRQAEADARAAAKEYHAQFLRPVIPVCLASLERGTPLTAAEMAKIGYQPGSFGSFYIETSEQKSTRTIVTGNGKNCQFGMTSLDVNGLGEYFTEALSARGYTRTGPKRSFRSGGTEYGYVKGDIHLALAGQTSPSVARTNYAIFRD